MAGEELARRIVQKELGRAVTINDNGSLPGMYDLRVGPANSPEIAIECVGAVDQIFTETWNVGPARGSFKCPITGDWSVVVASGARIKAIKQRIGQLLLRLEERGVYEVYVDYRLKWHDAILFNELDSLKITQAYCYRLQGTGKVDLGMPGMGGAVDDKGNALPEWVGEFLRDSARKDVLDKLQRSGATDRQAFILVDYAGAPWPVQYYLMGELEHIPSQALDLPLPVTGVWIVSVSGFGSKGIRWDGNAWRVFHARGDDIE